MTCWCFGDIGNQIFWNCDPGALCQKHQTEIDVDYIGVRLLTFFLIDELV